MLLFFLLRIWARVIRSIAKPHVMRFFSLSRNLIYGNNTNMALIYIDIDILYIYRYDKLIAVYWGYLLGTQNGQLVWLVALLLLLHLTGVIPLIGSNSRKKEITITNNDHLRNESTQEVPIHTPILTHFYRYQIIVFSKIVNVIILIFMKDERRSCWKYLWKRGLFLQ